MNLSGFKFSLENPNFPTAAFLERGKRGSRVSNSDPSSAFSPIINYVIEKEVLAPKRFQNNRLEAGRQPDYKSAVGSVIECIVFSSFPQLVCFF